MGLGLDFRARRKDGTELPVDVSLVPKVRGGRWQIGAFVRDATERRRNEDLHAYVNEISRSALSGDDTRVYTSRCWPKTDQWERSSWPASSAGFRSPRGETAAAEVFASAAAIVLALGSARQSLEALRMTSEHERIARDLHDVVIQRLFALGMRLQAAERLAQGPAAKRIRETVDAIDEVIREIRETIFDLNRRDSSDPDLRGQPWSRVPSARLREMSPLLSRLWRQRRLCLSRR